jgi:lysyl-tRNA synthetase class 2
LTEKEELIFKILSNENQLLVEVKNKSGLSNKAWDKSIKSLRKLELVKVEKIENDIYISKIN